MLLVMGKLQFAIRADNAFMKMRTFVNDEWSEWEMTYHNAGSTIQLGGVSTNSGNTLTVEYNKFRRIALCMYPSSSDKTKLFGYTEIPIDILKEHNSTNGGYVYTHKDNYYMYARYISETQLLIWLSADAANAGYYGIARGVR